MLKPFERNLNLWKKHLGHVPDSVWCFADQLETLVLADNDLADISERIGELRARGLRMLDLGHNLLTVSLRILESCSNSATSFTFTAINSQLYRNLCRI
jgi:hypothetical protein